MTVGNQAADEKTHHGTPSFPIRVLVVDDSAYLRKVISEMLARSPLIEVVGVARNGTDALKKVVELKPDVVTLDLFMPEMDGVAFLEAQMARRPLPVVVCSIASETGENVVAAMESGAVEFIRKPTALSIDRVFQISTELISKVITAAQISPEKLSTPTPEFPPQVLPSHPSAKVIDAVVLGISTGGPQALRYLLPLFPADLPVPLAIVLHMPTGYTGPLAEKLNELSQVEVLEATEGLEMHPGRVILGQAGRQFALARSGERVVARLEHSAVNTLYRPSVDILFRSAATVYGQRVLAVVMTGMGNDGTQGAAWIKAQGGKVITEAESSCVVYGMPRSVVEAGLSDRVAPLNQLAQTILEMI